MGDKVHKIHEGVGPRGGKLLYFHCPGCKNEHPFEIECADKGWTWNGSLDKPTFKPSLLVNESYPQFRCHLFVTDGKIQFLPDCHHELRGQTVEMEDYEE